MRQTFLKSAVIAVAAGLSFGAAHASAGPISFTPSSSMDSSGKADTKERAPATLGGLLNRFTLAWSSDASSSSSASDTENCPQKKDDKKQVADADEAKKAGKSDPQGPEPVYFAF